MTYTYQCLAKGNYLFTGGKYEGVTFFDITDRKNPARLFNIKDPAYVQDIIVSSGFKFLYALSNGIVYCFDIT